VTVLFQYFIKVKQERFTRHFEYLWVPGLSRG